MEQTSTLGSDNPWEIQLCRGQNLLERGRDSNQASPPPRDEACVCHVSAVVQGRSETSPVQARRHQPGVRAASITQSCLLPGVHRPHLGTPNPDQVGTARLQGRDEGQEETELATRVSPGDSQPRGADRP